MQDRPRTASPGVGRMIALLALFSGVALLLTILADVSLSLALAATATVAIVLGVRAASRLGARDRHWVLRTLAAAAIAGILATIVYDIAKATLSVVDPSPYNPFEAIRAFGGLLIGTPADATLILVAGGAFHLLNGTAFGVAYTFFFARAGRTTPRRALLTGMGWGVFLETFQLTLYPGWLDIRLYQEFATISALSHLAYGATLGLVVRQLLRRAIRRHAAVYGAAPQGDDEGR